MKVISCGLIGLPVVLSILLGLSDEDDGSIYAIMRFMAAPTLGAGIGATLAYHHAKL